MKEKLYHDLACVINGEITIHIITNMLIVDISAYGIHWRYTTADLKNDHAFDIVSQYHDHIFNLFFNADIDE